jgi:hypothetical protein
MDTVEWVLQQMKSTSIAHAKAASSTRRNRSGSGTPPAVPSPDTAGAEPESENEKPQMTRDTAMAAVPVQIPPRRVEDKNAKRYITVNFQRRGWQRMLGGNRDRERTFGLDTYGQSVYDACNGQASVETIIRNFARSHHLSTPESETAVTKFLKVLVSKGLLVMTLEEE